jgi:hypothetical protein
MEDSKETWQKGMGIQWINKQERED